MSKPLVVGLMGNKQDRDGLQLYAAEAAAVAAVVNVVRALPLIVPPIGSDAAPCLELVSGLFFTGGLSNIHPTVYGGRASKDDEPFDRERDATALPLLRAALDRGIPILGTCRGFQELNVALGGTLKRESDDLPEAEKHGTPPSAESEEERFALRHKLKVAPGGMLRHILQTDECRVNSLHSQLVDRLAPGLTAEGFAEDSTVEAVSVRDARGFALGVAFHPEFWAEDDPASLAILSAFGDAVRRYSIEEAPARFSRAHA